jgi:hypothetical protein
VGVRVGGASPTLGIPACHHGPGPLSSDNISTARLALVEAVPRRPPAATPTTVVARTRRGERLAGRELWERLAARQAAWWQRHQRLAQQWTRLRTQPYGSRWPAAGGLRLARQPPSHRADDRPGPARHRPLIVALSSPLPGSRMMNTGDASRPRSSAIRWPALTEGTRSPHLARSSACRFKRSASMIGVQSRNSLGKAPRTRR